MSPVITPRLVAPMLAIVMSFALAGPIVATASASSRSIIGVVSHWSPIVQKDEQRTADAEKKFKKSRQTAPVVADFNHEVSDLHAFVLQLKGQSASSRRDGQGRDEIVSGATLIAKSYSKFASELTKAGSKGLSRSQLTVNAEAVLAGHKKWVAGVRLLAAG